MIADVSRYVHILAFECPNCGNPVLEWTFSPMQNLESVDASALHPKCVCGWTSRWLGAQARGHLVFPWPESAERQIESENEGEGIDEEAGIEPDTGNPV